MSMICPNAGCKAKKGPCLHEIGLLVIVIAAVIYFTVLKK